MSCEKVENCDFHEEKKGENIFTFFNWRCLVSRSNSGRNNPLPPKFYGLPVPNSSLYPRFFFIKMSAKDCLKARGQLLFRFYAVLKLEGVATIPRIDEG